MCFVATIPTHTRGLVIVSPQFRPAVIDHTLATFGPQTVPNDHPVTGNLLLVQDSGCNENDYGSFSNGKIVMVQRNDCDFIKMAEIAQGVNASALVVYDDQWEPLRRMDTDDSAAAATIHIPCLFISQNDGEMVADKLRAGYSFFGIVNSTGFVDNPWDTDWQMSILWFLFIAFVIMWVIVLACFSTALCRRWCHRTARQRAVRGLRRRKYKVTASPRAEGAEKNYDPEECACNVDPESRYSQDTCVICLSEFENGDKLIVLPCDHEFHADCIKPWILKKSNKCPICKRSFLTASNGQTRATSATTETPLLQSDSVGTLGGTDGGSALTSEDDDFYAADAPSDGGSDDDGAMIEDVLDDPSNPRGDFWTTRILGLHPGALVLTAACCTGVGIAIAIVIFLMTPGD